MCAWYGHVHSNVPLGEIMIEGKSAPILGVQVPIWLKRNPALCKHRHSGLSR